MEMPVAYLFVSSFGLSVWVGLKEQRTTCDLWLVPLHYIPIVIYFLHVVSCVNRPMTTKPTYNHNYNQHHPPPPSSTTVPPDAVAPSPKLPLFPLVVSWPAGDGLVVKTAERQPDEGNECEGRRGRAPDLSEWGRPTREMYSLPLLYRNPSPYEY